MPDTAQFLARCADEFGRRVEAIGDEQWHLPTPCTEWDVTALVRHLIYECLWLKPLLEGETIKQVGDRFEGDILGADPKAAWRRASSDAVAVAKPELLERTVRLSYGPSSGHDYAKEVATDLLIHAWDLARGISADERLDPELIETAHERLAPIIPQLTQTGLFGEVVDVPEGVDLQTKLLALLGRRAF
jgi:uncharacterized protein (TIGR03086 family)